MLCVPVARHPVSKELRQQLCRSLNSVVKHPLSSAIIGRYWPFSVIVSAPPLKPSSDTRVQKYTSVCIRPAQNTHLWPGHRSSL